MKTDTRSPIPLLRGSKLEFFYGILTLWESNEQNKVINDFKTPEIKRFLARRDSKGHRILHFKIDKNKICPDCKYELYVRDTKKNIGRSLLYHLRNAFAHNRIQLINNDRDVFIESYWKNELKLKTIIPFRLLKELVETLRGQHNLTPQEKMIKVRKHKNN